MADHTLRLKALLDTSDIKNELQSLRQTQNSALGTPGVGSSGVSANFNNLNSTLAKLNTSISDLQKTIERINTRTQKDQNHPDNPGGDWFTSEQTKRLVRTFAVTYGINTLGNAVKEVYNAAGDPASKRTARSIDTLQTVTSFGLQGAMAGGPIGAGVGAAIGIVVDSLKGFAEELKDSQQKIKEYTATIREGFKFDDKVYKQLNEISFNDRIKFIREQYDPYKNYSNRARALAEMNVDTPERAEYLAEQYRKGADRLRSEKIGEDFIYDTKKENLLKNRQASLSLQLVEAKTSRDALQKKLRDRGEVDDEGKLVDQSSLSYRMNLGMRRVLISQGGGDPAAFEAQSKKMREEYYQLISKIVKLDFKIAEAAADFEQFNKAIKRRAQIESEIAQMEANEAQMVKAAEELRKKQRQKDEKEAADLNAYRSQAENLWKTYKQDVESRQNQGDNISDPTKRYNYYISQANEADKKYKDTLYRATYAGTSEETKRLLEEAKGYKQDYDFNRKQADFFGDSVIDALREKLSDLKAPDNTQVNSLASSGYMINKNDDEIRWRQQTDYASQQTQLQREIRDRLNQMDAGSTFQ